MKLARIDAEHVYLPTDSCESIGHAGDEARDRDYQFFIYNKGLYLVAYWRNGPYVDYFQLDIDVEDVVELSAEIAES